MENHYIWLLVVLMLAGCEPRQPSVIRELEEAKSLDDDAKLQRASELLSPYVKFKTRGALPDVEFQDREIAEGLELLREFLEDHPENWSAHWLLGRTLRLKEDNEQSCDALAEAFRLQKNEFEVARDYARSCLALGRVEAGLAAARRCRTLDPNNVDAKGNLAVALLLAGEWDQAEQLIEEALEDEPNDLINQNIARVIQEVKTGERAQPKTLSDCL